MDLKGIVCQHQSLLNSFFKFKAKDEIGRLYACSDEFNVIYELDPDTLIAVNSASSPSSFLTGIGGTKNSLYSCDLSSDLIYEHDIDTLLVVNSGETVGSYQSGIGGIWGRLYACDYGADLYYEIDPWSLLIVNTVSNGDGPYGIGGTNDRLYSCERFPDDYYYELDPDTLIDISSFESPERNTTGVGGLNKRLYRCNIFSVNYCEEVDPDTFIVLNQTVATYTGIGGIKTGNTPPEPDPPEGVVTFNNTSGQGASVSLGDLSSEVPDSFTVEFFVENFSCGSRYCRLFHTTEIVSSATRVALSARNGNDIYGAGTYSNFPSTKQKIVIVYDSTTNSTIEYINGQNTSVSGRPSGIDSWWIGTSPSSPGDNYYIAGDFSEIGIYNYAKDATQVASESTATPSLSDSGIIRYYTGANDGVSLFEYVEGDHGVMNNFL